MMKKKLCLLTLLIVVLCAFSRTPDTYAAEVESDETIIMPLYVTIKSGKASLTLTDSGVHCSATVTTQRKADIDITMYLQKKSGTTWVNVKTWNTSADNAASLSLQKNYTVASGTFRVKALMEADGEMKTVITSSKAK